MPELWYPYAQRRPLGEQTEPALTKPDQICLHTMVGSLWGTDGMFHDNGYGGTESHFGVGYDGETLQWQDLGHQADANYDGNGHIISIETADYGPGFGEWNTNDGSAVPAWTDAQIERLADLIAWLCREYGIPCQAIPDSKPGRTGIGWHRLGIDPYRVDGGEHWSTSYGKVCPGDRRLAQIPEVIRRAQAILAGEEEFDVDTKEQIDRIDKLVTTLATTRDGKYAVAPGQRTVGEAFPAVLGHVQDQHNSMVAFSDQIDQLKTSIDTLTATVQQLVDREP